MEQNYLDLMKDILSNGVVKDDRTGTGTISVFGRQARYNMFHGFPLLTTKKMDFQNIVVELLWFLKGKTNIKYLIENGCNIWTGDAYKNYCQKIGKEYQISRKEFSDKILLDNSFANLWGEMGPIYGSQWRNWNNKIDQIKNVIETLKNDPDSRRMVVSAWNVEEIQNMVLPPCHYAFQFYTQKAAFEKRFLSIKCELRSNDYCLGNPYDLASYALLLHIVAKQVDMIPFEVILSIGDAHIYSNHIEKAKEQILRKPNIFPELLIAKKTVNDISEYEIEDFSIVNYNHYPRINYPLSN